MAALIRALAVAGSTKTDGTPNASGKVFLYAPGTTTIVAGYQDDQLSQAWTTSAGGIPLDVAGKVEIWLNDVVDVVVEDSSGTIVDTFLGFNRTRAEQVEVENEGFTGALTDSSGAVTQALGGKTDLDTILTRAVTSLGPNFQYQESPGAEPQDYIDIIRQIHITPQNFGAAGDGINDDTAAIVAAIAELVRLGGGVLYFPPGNYLISDTLDLGTALADADGISIVGAGSQATTITGVGIGIFYVYASAFRLKGMTVTSNSSSTDTAINIQNGEGVIIEDVVSPGTYRNVIDIGLGQQITIRDCNLRALNGDAVAHAIRGSVTSGVTIISNHLEGGTTGTAINVNYSTSSWLIAGNVFANSAVGIRYDEDPFTPGTNVPTGITVIGNPTLSAIATPISGGAPIGGSRQLGNGLDGYVVTQASGGGGGSTHTPNMLRGDEVHVRLTSGGAAICTINAPTGYSSTTRNTRLSLRLTAAAGGAITWTFDVTFVLVGGGSTIAGADTTTTIVEFEYDLQTAEWRERFRSATAT